MFSACLILFSHIHPLFLPLPPSSFPYSLHPFRHHPRPHLPLSIFQLSLSIARAPQIGMNLSRPPPPMEHHGLHKSSGKPRGTISGAVSEAVRETVSESMSP